LELDKEEGKFVENWDPERKLYVMLLTFKKWWSDVMILQW
jgi:hypothetical protein